MNISQIERILEHIKKIKDLVEEEEDSAGAIEIKRKLYDLYEAVKKELKELVWKRYLEEKRGIEW